MAKQTLYEILGVAEDASDDDMQRAFEGRRKALCEEFEGEDRRNYLSFLDHARQVLADPRRRAAYDRQNRANAADPEPQPAPRRKGPKAFVALFVLLAGALLWRQLPPKTESVAAKAQVRAAAAKSPEQPVAANELPSAEEAAAALMPLPPAAEPGAAARPTVAAAPPATVSPAPVARVVAALPGSPLMNRILESTYAIVGS